MRSRLSLMMLVQYIIWGLWYSTLGNFMLAKGFSSTQIPLAYLSTAIASMVSPFFVGMVADRFFSTERVMATLHALGAIFAVVAVGQNSFSLFFTFLLIHTICYMPTLPLANSLSFKQLKNPAEEFPTIRVFGSLGWIAAGFIISLCHFDKSAGMFYTTAAFSIGMAFYCLTLPHTPPVKTEKKPTVGEILGLDALALLKDRNVLVFMLGSFLTCIPLTFYFNETGMYLGESGIEKISMTMTIGQWIEAGFFLIMPIMLRDLGIKKVILLGMLCWALRLLCFGTATGTTGALIWMIIMGIALHGMSYDFFFVTGQVYIDRKAPQHVRSAAQGLLYFLTLGAGMFVGGLVVTAVNAHYSHVAEVLTADGVYQSAIQFDWYNIWHIAAIMSAIVFLMFALAFKDDANREEVARRNPGKAWGVVAGIVVIMFALSFGLQSYFHKVGTCAGHWEAEGVKAEITTASSSTEAEINGEKHQVSIISGDLVLTTKKDGKLVSYIGKIADMNREEFIKGDTYTITFPATLVSREEQKDMVLDFYGKKKEESGKEVSALISNSIHAYNPAVGMPAEALKAITADSNIKGAIFKNGALYESDSPSAKKIESFTQTSTGYEVKVSYKAHPILEGQGVITWVKQDATRHELTFEFADKDGAKTSFNLKQVRKTYSKE